MEIIGILGFLGVLLIAYNRENSIERCLSSHKALKKLVPVLVCGIISFLLANRLNLSPFNNMSSVADSSVFLYIGKNMHSGLVPYKDLFDHKGIVLYFIEYLGYLIGLGHEIGVWIIEWISLFVTTYLFYCISRIFVCSKIVCYMSTYIVVSLCAFQFFDGGNLVEEYALPWITLSLYYVVKFFKKKEYTNLSVIIIGFSFAVVFFLRVNMVGLWGAFLLAVTFYFIKNKKVMELLKCAGLFVLGCLIVTVPIILYLLHTNSLKEMIDCYFIFNLSYTGADSRIGIITFFFECVSLAGVASFFIMYSLVIQYKNKILWLNLVTLLFAYLSAAISGRSYHHYGIILIPFFVIPTVISINPILEKTREIIKPINKKSIVSILTILCVVSVSVYPAYLLSVKIRTPSATDKVCDYINSQTIETDDVLVLGNYSQYYLNCNRRTNNRFFYQIPPIDISEKLYDEFVSELESNPSDYIINTTLDIKNKNGNYQRVLDYLDNKCEKGLYQLEEYDGFHVYVRK